MNKTTDTLPQAKIFKLPKLEPIIDETLVEALEYILSEAKVGNLTDFAAVLSTDGFATDSRIVIKNGDSKTAAIASVILAREV